MTTFVLRTEEGEDLAFLGFAAHEGDWPPEGSNDCIFMPCPWGVSSNDPMVQKLLGLEGREWQAGVTYSESDMRVRIVLDADWIFELRSGESGSSWKAEGPERTLQGTGQFL